MKVQLVTSESHRVGGGMVKPGTVLGEVTLAKGVAVEELDKGLQLKRVRVRVRVDFPAPPEKKPAEKVEKPEKK